MSANTFAAFGGLVPLSWSGHLTYGYGYVESAGSQVESTNLQLGVNGSGYVWRPWFATTSMALDVGLSNAETSSSSSDAKSTGGSFSLGVFPGSRFPFSLDYSRSDSRSESFRDVSGSSGESAFQVQRLSLRQVYRPRSKGQRYNAWYYLTEFDSESLGSESISYGLDYDLHVTHQSLSANATHFESKVKDVSNNPSTDILSASYVYAPSTELGVNSLASVVEVDTGAGVISRDTQAFGSFHWRPEHRAVNVGGGVRLSESDSGQAVSSVTRSLNTNLSLGYRVTRSLNVRASAAVGTSDSAGSQSLSTSQAVSVSYSGSRHQIAGLAYGWQGGSGASNSTTRTEVGGVSNSEDAQSLSASLGHNLSGSWTVGQASSIAAGLSQSGSGSKSSETDVVSKTLSHSVNLSWRSRSGPRSAFVSGRISDSRGFGESDTVFTNLGINATGDYKISRLSGMQAGMVYSASRSELTSALDDTVENDARLLSGSLSYQNSRPFGIYNLQFSSGLTGSKQIDSPQPTTVLRWDGRFRYSLGLLVSTLTFRASETASGDLTKSMSFQATRTF